MFLREGRLDDGHAHVERATSYTVNNTFNLGTAMMVRAMLWKRQYRLEEARSEILRAADVFEKLGSSRARRFVRGSSRRSKRE
jgi:hypothetical protein